VTGMIAFLGYLFKDLRHDWGRSLLTVASLSIMVISYLLTAALADAFDEFGSRPGVVSHNLVMLAADTIDPMQGSVSQEAFDLAVAAVQAQFGPQSVRRAEPTIFRTLRIQGDTMEVFAVAPVGMTEIYNLALLAGRLPTGRAEIAASQEAVSLAGWQVGQEVEFYGQFFQLVGEVRYEAGKIASLWMTYDAGMALFGERRGFQVGALNISGELDPETVRAYLESVPGIRPAYAVYLEHDVHARYGQAIQDLLKFTIVMDILALSVITFGVFNATSLTLTERSREIALLRVAGFSGSTVRRFLFGRALVQTLAAYLLGWGLARLVTWKHAASSFSMHGMHVQIILSPQVVLPGLVLTSLCAWLAVWLTTHHLGQRNLVVLLNE